MLYDFHTHSFHSDGVLSPLELINRAAVRKYTAIAITDHMALGSLERVIKEVTVDCALARKYWNISAIPGVELTHLPPSAIAEVSRRAKELGAAVVVVHGETTSEPVPVGTNLAAVNSPFVDILAHPGAITPEEARLAVKNNIFIELSARRSHRNSNTHVAKIGLAAGAKLLLDSDAHNEDDLLTPELINDILTSAGITENQQQILEKNPQSLLQKINWVTR
jgi:putative hydrolase